MEEVNLTETESRYFADLFLCCETEKSNKVPILKATEMFRSANLSNDVLRQITSLAGIPQTAIHMSRAQFYACLKLIAAHQASMQLREELISSTILLPLPKFSWKDTNDIGTTSTSSSSSQEIKRNSVQWRPPMHETIHSSKDQQHPVDGLSHSDFPSTDSEIEHNDVEAQDRSHQRLKRSPEAWSTASDSPTPTNSVAERSWTKNNLWDGLLCEEQRELLGTEEESSDRHSSDDDDDDDDADNADPVLEVIETPETLESLYKITPEQRTYYVNQFKTVQPDINGLISGQVAKVFFEKSRIPVKELRHIWQLCDITRDGALNLNEFIAAMHLIVLRRNCIPVPTVLPVLLKTSIPLGPPPISDPPEADLLHLDDDKTLTSSSGHHTTTNRTEYKRIAISGGNDVSDGPSSYKTHQLNHHKLTGTSPVKIISSSHQQKKVANNSPQSSGGIIINNNSTSTVAVASIITPPLALQLTQQLPSSASASSSSTLPSTTEHMSPVKLKETDWSNQSKEWTKFTESPTSNLSSPGPKPANFDMQRTAQAVGSDPQILHPVPLRVTPSGIDATDDDLSLTSNRSDFHKKSDSVLYDGGGAGVGGGGGACGNSATVLLASIRNSEFDINTSKQINQYRDSLQNDLRAIQRPQSKKLPTKNVGGLPPPPQREPSIGSAESTAQTTDIMNTSLIGSGGLNSKKEQQQPPPPPPPRPHKHARSSSLDLNKFKLNEELRTEASVVSSANYSIGSGTTTLTIAGGISNLSNCLTTPSTAGSSLISGPDTHPSLSTDLNSSTGIACAIAGPSGGGSGTPPRHTIHFVQTSTTRSSAFEVYRKPASTSFYSPEPITNNTTTIGADNEHVMSSITENLRNTKFKQEKNLFDVMHQLKEQNALLLRLCYDLNEELKCVKQKKEEIISQLETSSGHHHSTV